ncbi:hypothetical protein G6F46_014835 [Rhizopus delemar]|nr:hypothetical protein G6F46_014835 [Rhizopus delemar]
MMLTTPPIASDPYSDDIGPRTTSIRSMAAKGGIWLACTMPSSSRFSISRVPCRLPSTRIRVYLPGMPRMEMSCLWALAPTMLTPSTLRNASCRVLKGCRARSSCVNTVMLAGASAMDWS